MEHSGVAPDIITLAKSMAGGSDLCRHRPRRH